MLLHRQREVGAALHRRVVRDDHALAALDDADAGDDPGTGRLAVVELPRGERAELEEGAARIDEAIDPLPGGELAALAMARDRLLAAAACDQRCPLAKLRDERLHPLAAPLELVVPHGLRAQHRHGRERTFR